MQKSLTTLKGNESPDPVLTDKPTRNPGTMNVSSYESNYGRSLSQQGLKPMNTVTGDQFMSMNTLPPKENPAVAH